MEDTVVEKGKHPLRIQKESLRVLDRGFIDDSERELEGFGERILGFVGRESFYYKG